ncbi:hypothetical protein FHS42_000344 [Streptomyces zagrosensis]|uniref:Uncharacterized protein n=1 Tax=Streptomyces zagrosensis TaxID=1042984 RepID=A0A7W9Q471_9ACTN|nr:hypothetical protein [Streptomyces zagrosensis]
MFTSTPYAARQWRTTTEPTASVVKENCASDFTPGLAHTDGMEWCPGPGSAPRGRRLVEGRRGAPSGVVISRANEDEPSSNSPSRSPAGRPLTCFP